MHLFEKDPKLGDKIHQILVDNLAETAISSKMNFEIIQTGVINMLKGLGLSLEDESLAKTPERVSSFLTNDLFYGLDYNNFPHISFDKNTYSYHTPIVSRDIKFYSTCEHHLVPIIGHATVAYIPNDRIIGFSKLNRIVDFFAKRPQVQERATLQILLALVHILNTPDVMVTIKAEHHCISMRGTCDPDTKNITYQQSGKFLDNQLLNLVLK